jgi:hypothetical protein
VNELSDKTIAVVDHGVFLPLARCLAKSGARVIYHNPSWADSYPTINKGIIGNGFPDIECVLDIWEVKNSVDAFVFPDIFHAGLQKELRAQGFAVWGAGDGMKLEINREYFMKMLGSLGLDVPRFEKIVGLRMLREYLADKKDIWIKMSRWRGSWETTHWRSYKEHGHLLDLWAVRFGGIKEMVTFLCFHKIDTTLEIGADTICVDGRWPKLMLHGIEAKDRAFLSAVTKQSDMPEELMPIMEAFSPFLKTVKYRQQWSMEVRVTEDAAYFLDATCRGGLPSTGSQILAMENLAEVIFYGAHGEFIEPEYNCKFTAECMVSIKGRQGSWETIVLPDELKDHVMLSDCCFVKGQPWFPAAEDDTISEIGWLVATGDTPTETAKSMNLLADLLPDGADAAVESLADIIREIESMTESGIEFTDQPLPDAEVVLEESA